MYQIKALEKPRIQRVSLFCYNGVTKKKVEVTECIPRDKKHLGLPGVGGVAFWVLGDEKSKMC